MTGPGPAVGLMLATAADPATGRLAPERVLAISRLLEVAPRYELRDIDFGPSLFVRGPESGVVTLGA